MIELAWPWAFLLLPVPLLVRLWAHQKAADAALTAPGERPGLLHPAPGHLSAAFAVGKSRTARGERLRVLLLAVCWTCLVLALARPQWLEEHREAVSRGYDLVLAVDGSRSMEALDFTVQGRQVSRMAVVKGVVDRFIAGREGDRVGLIIFGDEAYMLSPLTVDVDAVRALLAEIPARVAGDGTSIGDAIGLAVKKLRDRPEGSRVLVLATDGKNTAGTLPPRIAAQLAASHGVRIHAIGVGRDGYLPVVEGGRVQRQRMEIDEELLREVATTTGGAYFRAIDAHALDGIYGHIDAMESSEADTRSVWLPMPLYRWPLAAGMATLLVLGLFPDCYRRRLQQRAAS